MTGSLSEEKMAEEVASALVPDSDRYRSFIESAEAAAAVEGSASFPGQCVPGCPGWNVFDVDRPPYQEIEKCDDCELFADDDAALEHALRLCLGPSECGDEECILCLKRLAGICDCGCCEDCVEEEP